MPLLLLGWSRYRPYSIVANDNNAEEFALAA